MTLGEFKASLGAAAPPPGISAPLAALWHDAKGDWDAAHDLVNAEVILAANWVHAYLHRKEGDASNAAYWYAQAQLPIAKDSLESEWARIAESLCDD